MSWKQPHRRRRKGRDRLAAPRWAAALGLCLSLGLLFCLQGQEMDHRTGDYRVTDSFEFGYRSAFVSGDRDMYRSSVNYNNGFRLFDGSLRLTSNDGHGLIDEINLTTFGAGGDPYQSSSLRVEKNRFFRLDMGFRIINYRNNLLSISGGEHGFNTEHILENYDLTLLPRRRVELVLGYGRSNQNGPSLTSQNIDARGEPAFPRDRFFVYASNLHQVNNEWRGGANVTLAGIKFSFLQGLNYYKQDPVNSLDALPAGGQTLAGGLIPAAFRRSDPIHGSTPFSRLNIHSDANGWFSVNGRFVYAGGSNHFVQDQNIANPNPVTGILVTRQDFVLGDAKRTQGTGDLTLSFQPGERWAFSNTSSINQTRITGASSFVEIRAPANPLDPGADQLFFDLLSVRLITNATDANFRLTPKIGLYAQYNYSIRRIQSRELPEDISGIPTGVPLYSFNNVENSGVAGIRLRPLPTLSLLGDFEYGDDSRPFTPISQNRFHGATAKGQWKWKSWLASASFKESHNRTQAPFSPLPAFELAPTTGSDYESRQYSANVGWSPNKPYGFDASYAKLHLDTASGILNFPVPGLPEVSGRRSLYLSNIHYGRLTFRWEIRQRATLFVGYSIVKDTAGGEGQGPVIPVVSSIPAPLTPFVRNYPNFVFNGADLINAYPLTYESPQARLSFRLNKRLDWNVGWQYYGYHEKFTSLQNYHANISYTSFRWSF